MKHFLGKKITLFSGDSREVLKEMPDNCIDSIVTDPPYALVSIVKRFGKPGSAPAKGNEAFMRASAGFMGKAWDTGEVAFDPAFWVECLRVLKPGGHLLSCGGTRTYHRMACAIEDAGFEIRDMMQWLYGTGFPKSHEVSKGIDRAGLDAEQWEGWGTALKPANEPIVLARKPLSEKTVAANVLKWGTGAINIDDCRVELSSPLGRFPANVLHDGSDEVLEHFPDSDGQKGRVDGQTSGNNIYGKRGARPLAEPRKDTGTAARFFYTAKANKKDRAGSKHPTIKPIKLLRYLIRLITPPGGVVLDPFAGSGTTGEAAYIEGFRAMLIEREPEYQEDIANRLRGLDNVIDRTTEANPTDTEVQQ